MFTFAILVAAAAAPDDVRAQPAPFPADADLDVVLTSTFDERTASSDQHLTFKIVRDVKKDATVLAPKNAVVNARVTQLQKHASFIRGTKRTYYLVGLKLLDVDVNGTAVPVVANLETVPPNAMNDYFVPLSHGPDKWGEFEQYRFQFKIPAAQPGESFLGIVREGLKLQKGLRLVFRTAAAPASAT